MATGGSPSQRERKEADMRYSCALCMEPYVGRTPKLLPNCHHTFCLLCLTALEASVRSGKHADRAEQTQEPTEVLKVANSAEQMEDAESTQLPHGRGPEDEVIKGSDDSDVIDIQDNVTSPGFPCPTCRTPVLIPEGGVKEFQTNFYVDHEPDPDGSPPNSLCDMCEEDNRQHATHVCQECQRSMCRSCRRYHDIMASNHHVMPVSLGMLAKGKGEKKGLCLVHQDQFLCFHCSQCEVAICVLCKVTSHEGHQTLDLATAALQAREEIRSLLPTTQQQLQLMKMSLEQVAQEEQTVKRKAQEMRQKIQAQRHLLVTWADRWQERLMEQVLDLEARTLGKLQGEVAWSTLIRDTLARLLTRAAHTTVTDPQVVSCRRELKAAMLSQDQLLHHQQRADLQGHPSWVFSYDLGDASQVLQEEDVRAFMGRVVEGGQAADDKGASSGTPYISLRELACSIEQLNREMTEKTDLLQQKGDQLQQKTDLLQQNGDQLQQKTDLLEQKKDELGKKTYLLQQNGDQMQEKIDLLKQKVNQLQQKTDLLQQNMSYRK